MMLQLDMVKTGMGTKVDATKDTDGTNFAMQQGDDSSRATATMVIPAISREIGPLLLNENISNNTKILKPKPTAPMTRKIRIDPIESIHKPCKNPNFVFRLISPAGQPQEAQGASPEGGLLTFKDFMDQNEHKAYEGEKNRVTAGNCNIYKQILAAAKENRKSSLKMSTRSDVEYPSNLDTNLTYNVHQSLQQSIPKYTEGKLRKVWMHIANSYLDETPLDTQMDDLEHQPKTINILPSLSTDLVQPSAVLCEHSKNVADAIPNNYGDDVTEDKEILLGISSEDKFDADLCASVSKEASALDLVQPSAVISEPSNSVSDAIPNNHDDDITGDKEILPGISPEDKFDADWCASVSKEASALDLVQPSAVISESGNTVSGDIPNNHGDDVTEDKGILPGISTEDKFDADRCVSVSKEASALDLVQASAVVSEPSNSVSDAIPNNHGDNATEDKGILPGISTEDKFDADRFASVSKEASALDLVQASAVVSEPSNSVSDAIPNNHGDNATEDKGILPGISTEDKFDADRFASVSKEAFAHDLVQPSVFISGPYNITAGTISVYKLGQLSSVLSKQNKSNFETFPNNHGDNSSQEQKKCGLHSIVTNDVESCESASKEEPAHTLNQSSTDQSESNKTIFYDIPSKHSGNTTPEEEIPRDFPHATSTIYNIDRCLDVTVEASAHKLYRSSAILSEGIPNNHGDSTKQDQEIPSGLNTVDTCDTDRYTDILTQTSANNLNQSQTVVRESAENIHDAVHKNHGHHTIQDQQIPCGHSTVAKYSAVGEDVPAGTYAHDLDQPSTVVGKTSIISEDTPNFYSNVSQDNEAMQSDQSRVTQYDSIAGVKESSGCNQSSCLNNNPFILRNKDGDAKVSSNVSEDSSIGEDDMLNEVYQLCLAKGMRPKYLSSNYLKCLANARKTAAEIKARKPEPRVKLDKPCRLDTNLMYAVRQSLKRSLPLIAGKNKLSALMVMADGMFDEMSLDRDLDDLAWPFDPLAELRESGLAMVDYMEPYPAGGVTINKSRVKNQSAAMLSESNKTIFDESQNNQGDATSQEEEEPYSDPQETVTNHDSGRCVDVLSESSAHKLDQCTGMLSESSRPIFHDIQKIQGDNFSQEQEMPSDNSQGTVTNNDSDRCVDVSSESSAHKLDQYTGMLSESSRTIFHDIQKIQGGNTSQEQEIPFDNSQVTVTNNDSDRCVDVSSESSAHKLDRCSGMLSESNKTVFNDIQNSYCNTTSQDQEILAGNSQGTLSYYDSVRCVDVSSESSPHKLDQCTSMLSESNKTAIDNIPKNHSDATYQAQVMPSDNSQGTGTNYDSERCVDIPMEASAYKLGLCPAVLSESNLTIFDNIQNINGDKISQEKEMPSDNSQETPADCDSESCVDVPTESSTHKLNQCMGMLSESYKIICEDFQKNQDDSSSDVQELSSNNLEGTAINYDAERYVDYQAFTHEQDHSVVVSERDITICNAFEDIREDQVILSSLGTTLEVSEEGCTGVPKELPVHKQNHVSADFGEAGTSGSNNIDVNPENKEIPSSQPIETDNNEENSANAKEDTSASETSESSDNVNNPGIQRSNKNSSMSPSISEIRSDDNKDMLNEVYQSCLDKGMRPKYLSKNYLKSLANARKTAAEVKARKPEPRVKLDKPCRLDTNLTYAVRQSLKRSLPLIAGKNKLSALMVMADGMFDEMSLDRDLDDLAWPFDPLAELRESGLAMVDYMDPHPADRATINTSDMKDQSSPSESVVWSASSQDENDHNSSDSVVKILDSVTKTKSPVPRNEQRSIGDEDISSDFNTEVSRLTGQPIATTATDDLSTPQHNSSETSLSAAVLREDLSEKLTENDSEIGSTVEMHESSQFDNLMNNHNILMPNVKCESADLEQISSIDLKPPTCHSSDILQTTSVDSDLQSEDSALGQDDCSTSFDDTCSTFDFSSDIEEVDPSSQNLKQKIQFFSNATRTSFSKPSSVSHVNFKVSVPSKVHHFEKLAQEKLSSKPQKFLAKDNQLATHNRLSSEGDSKIIIEQFERMRVPTAPTVSTKHETLDSSTNENTSASRVNVMNRVKMFELCDGMTAFNKQPTSAAKPKTTGRLNKSKIAFFEHLANSNI
ncbi:hypothetical protein HOLleu_07640 [Holothuria leucospilota]|uniref:Uncharacterized protein n=1 Tax=Holothuria leucospilota TaxID=206669 RepID=A0A9Q1HCX1_HOLLE|nr:hypothetical protein HOLleu_07640 [Holothuria leucospilota]